MDINNGSGNGPRNKRASYRTIVIWVCIAALAIALISGQFLGNARQDTTELSTSEFVTAVNDGNVKEVTYVASSGNLKGQYWTDDVSNHNDDNATNFTSTYVGQDSLATLMQDHPDVTYKVDVSNTGSIWATILSTALPLLLLLGLGWLLFSQMNGMNNKQMGFGKTKAKKTAEDRPTTKFSDVAGIDEAVEELDEVREYLANPAKFQVMGAKVPRGVLLVGPPGTGKTLLARAVAGEAGVPFFSISGSDFVEMFVGVGASRVRDLFEQAKEAAPSIIFIDEIDAVGRQRGAGLGGGHDEREQTLNQLLVEMDGFDQNETVILIAATNRVDILDPALLRPGRFDRQVVVDRPDLKGREQILRVHSQRKPLATDVDLSRLARLTTGFTGADLANLMNEGALLAARRSKRLISMDELNEAMERTIAGPERKSRIVSDKEKRTIAFHEGGHALVGHILDNSDPVHKITILPRGQALGYTMQVPTEDRFLNSRNEMLDQLAVLLSGRVSEEIFCDDITTGASNDLERATKTARQMVTRFGMSEALGTQVFGEANHEVFLGRDYSATPDYSEETANRIDEEVARIMRSAHDRAYKILDERRDQMDTIATVLLDRETVEGAACEALLNNEWTKFLLEEKDIIAAKEAEEAAAAEAERKAAEEAAAQAAARAQQMGQGTIPPLPGAPSEQYNQAAQQPQSQFETQSTGPLYRPQHAIDHPDEESEPIPQQSQDTTGDEDDEK